MFQLLLIPLSILSFAYLARSQCDSDGSIKVFLNSSNPYCTKYSGSDCTCCGYSQDSLYLYGSECTVGTSSDLLSGEKILKKCDTNCASGYCQNGVCSKCNTLSDQTKKFYLYVSPGDNADSCVPQCEHFKGFFRKQDDQTCSTCPVSCTICDSPNGCQECIYNLARLLDTDQSSFTTKINEGSLYCTQHETRKTLTAGDDGYLTKYYITPANRGCNSDIQCDGTIDNPYDDINLVFKQLVENIKIWEQTKLKIEILFLRDNDNIIHFWREDSSLPTHYKRLFERTLIDATFSPALCSDTTKCFSDQAKAVIVIKSNLISIFATWNLLIQNIIFDGSELIPEGVCYEANKNSTKRCCDSSSLTDLPTRAESQSDAICNAGMALGTLLHPYLNYDPTADIWPFGPYSFITLQMIHDATEIEIPTLTIDGCEFRHFWYHRYARSLITLSNYGSHVTIKDTSFNNFYFTNGLITNVHESIQRDTLFTKNVVPSFDCTQLDPSLTECFSLIIEGSSFTNSLFGDFEFSTLANQLKPSNTLASASLSKNEGIVLFLVSFNGPITIRDSTFGNLASSVFSTSEITCSTERRVIFKNLFHSLDRLIQIELGHEKFQNLQSSSVMNIRNVLKGITIYNNTFQNNLAQTGTNFLIHNFKNTNTYPIIIEKNIFKHNLAQLFGSSFAIVNYARDYVSMRCEGIYIAQNTFEENIQCPNAVGNVIVACIPEKSLLSPIFSKSEIPSQVNEDPTWNVYYPSVNQATDTQVDSYNTVTQLAFTMYYRNLNSTKDKVNQVAHPITGASIDISRVQILSNTFTNNYASIAQLFVQGASKVSTTSNIFKDNSFAFSVFFPASVTSLPIFAKVISNQEAGYFVSTALMIRLGGYINMINDMFINNTQVATNGPTSTMGSAISFDRYLAYINLEIQNVTVNNHIGLDFSGIRSLDSFIQSQTASATLTALETRGASPPLITYSIWENFAGVTYSRDVSPSVSVSTSNRQSIMQGQELYCSVIFTNGTFQANAFKSGINSQGTIPRLEAVIWYFKDDDRETVDFTLTKKSYSRILRGDGAILTLLNLFFTSNKVEDNRNFISSSIFSQIYLLNNTFRYNSVTSNSETTRNGIFAIAPKAMQNPGVTTRFNVWEYNVGIVLLVNYTEVITNFGYYPNLIFNESVINHHVSPFATIYACWSYLVRINTLSAQNVTAGSAFMIFEVKTDSTWLYNVNITDLTTSYNGCLGMFDCRDRTQLINVTCSNSKVIIPTQIQNPAKNFKNLGSCFNIQDQLATDTVWTNVTCNSPRIVYQSPNIVQAAPITALCVYISTNSKIVFTRFKCINATYEASQNDTNLMLGWFDNAGIMNFTGSHFILNSAYAPIQATATTFIFNDARIKNNSFQTLSSFLHSVGGTLTLTGAEFINNTCKDCSGGITVFKSQLLIQRCTFTDNSATQGSVLDAKMVSAKILNSTFTRNKADVHSSVLISFSSDVVVDNCSFEANEAPSRTFTLSGGSFKISNSYLKDNSETTAAVPYIKALKLEVDIVNTTFNAINNYQYATKGFFLSVLQGGASIKNCSFSDGAAESGGAIYLKGMLSPITVQDSNFTRNKAVYGGAIYVDGDDTTSSFLVTNCIFQNNSATKEAGSIWNQASDTTIINSYFKTNNDETLRLGRGNYLITNVILEGNKMDSETSSSTFAIFASDVYMFNMSNSSVKGFNFDESQITQMSSPVQLIGQGQDTYYFKNVTFEGNSGNLGGAIHASRELDLKVNNCSFINNSATEGGAIYFNGTLSNLMLEGNCLFEGNEASSAGGAIQYTARNVKIDSEETTFLANNAPYGNDIGGYGVYLEQIPFNQTLYDIYLAEKQALLSSWERRLEQNDTASGNVYQYDYRNGEELNPPLMYALKDEFHNLVTYDNHSTAKIIAERIGDSRINVTYKSSSQYTAFMGYFILTNLKVYIGPKSGVKLNLNLTGINGTQTFANKLDFPDIPEATPTIVPAKVCVIGEIITEDTCSPCPTEEFTLTNGSSSACNKCPSEGFCGGHNIFGPKVGYWRLSSLDVQLNECKNNQACLGALVEDERVREKSYCPPENLYNESFCLTGWCREGYQGRMCANCQEGWAIGNTLLSKCTLCSDTVQHYVIQAILIALGVLYLIIIIRSSLKPEGNLQSEGPIYQSRLKEKRRFPTNNMAITVEDEVRYDMLAVSSSRKGKVPVMTTTESGYQPTVQDNPTQGVTERGTARNPERHTPRDTDTHRDTERGTDRGNKENINKEAQQNLRVKSEIYLRIITSHIQTVAIIGTFDLEWPQEQRSYFAFGQAISESPADILSFDCLWKQTIFPVIGVRTFAMKLIAISLSPVVFFILIAIGWTIFYLIKYRTKFSKYRHLLKINVLVSSLVFLFILHPSILQFTLKALWCETLGDDPDSSYLQADTQMKCWSPDHYRLFYGVALPSLVIWGVGIPTLGLLLLIQNRKVLKVFETRRKYGFLYEGYQEKFYYWELVVTYRKLVYILIAIFLSQSSLNVKACAALGVGGLAYVLHVRFLPFQSKSLNALEQRSIIIATVTIYCAMFQLTRILAVPVKVLSIICLVIANLYFFVYWFVGFARAKSEEYLLRSPFLVKHCGGVLIFFAKFKWKQLLKKQIDQKTDKLQQDPNTQNPNVSKEKSIRAFFDDVNTRRREFDLRPPEPTEQGQQIMTPTNNNDSLLEIIKVTSAPDQFNRIMSEISAPEIFHNLQSENEQQESLSKESETPQDIISLKDILGETYQEIGRSLVFSEDQDPQHQNDQPESSTS